MRLADAMNWLGQHGTLVAMAVLALALVASGGIWILALRGRHDRLSDEWTGRRRPYVPGDMP